MHRFFLLDLYISGMFLLFRESFYVESVCRAITVVFFGRDFCIMNKFLGLAKGIPLLAAGVIAAATYPAIPVDLTTPVQQRIAVNGPNGELNFQFVHAT